MTCQRCNSGRVLRINSHSRDLNVVQMGDKEVGPGYFPSIPSIGNGDDVFPDIYLNYGQVQGNFPVVLSADLAEALGDKNE